MSPPPLIVVFGAALRPDGTASEALARRIACGVEAARAHPLASVLCSGGAQGRGPTEASVIAAALIRAGVARGRLVLDEASLTTRQNVEAAVRAAATGGHAAVVACSDRYHLPRVRALLRLAGLAVVEGPRPSRPPLTHHLAMSLREAAALAHNLTVAIARTGRSPAHSRPDAR